MSRQRSKNSIQPGCITTTIMLIMQQGHSYNNSKLIITNSLIFTKTSLHSHYHCVNIITITSLTIPRFYINTFSTQWTTITRYFQTCFLLNRHVKYWQWGFQPHIFYNYAAFILSPVAINYLQLSYPLTERHKRHFKTNYFWISFSNIKHMILLLVTVNILWIITLFANVRLCLSSWLEWKTK